VLGDRWSMLVIRELSFGDARFSALRQHLAGISPTLLTERLQTLTAQHLVATRPATSGARTVYTLTRKGREALPILRAMARFGMALLPSPRRGAKVRPETAAYAAVNAYHDRDAAAGIDERYRLVLDDQTFDLTSGPPSARAADAEPDLVLTGPARAMVAARRGETTLSEALAAGTIQARGSKRALRHFQRVFRLP